MLNPFELVKQSYDFPACAWETPYAAQIGKRKLLSILRYQGNRKPVNNLWDVPR